MSILAPRITTKNKQSDAFDLFSKQPSHTLQYTVLFRVVWVVFAWDLEYGRKCCGIGIDAMADTFCDLFSIHGGKHSSYYPCECRPYNGRRTCWLIRSTAISFRSWVKLSNAFSIVEVSVLESTTRKFRWASGPSVTCYGKKVIC